MSAADRMRRYRDRRDRGRRVITLEISLQDEQSLVDRGLLNFDEDNPAEIAAALRTFLNETFGA